eukprot:g8514.t1
MQDSVIEVKSQFPAIDAKKHTKLYLAGLALGALTCGVGFSTLQERVFKIDGFEFGGWMSFLTYLSWIILSMIEMSFKGRMTRHASIKEYAIVSVFAMLGGYLTNWSLQYLNYATRVIVKSCKVLPVMILRVFVSQKHYRIIDYLAALTLAVRQAGIVFYTLGDKEAYPEFNAAGFTLIGIALVCDALTSNLEERWFFNIPEPCSNFEVVHYLSLFSCPFAFTLLSISGELTPALLHSIQHPTVIPLIFAFSILGYFGVEFVLLIVQHFGATQAEIVKSLRRVLQVTLSFVIFPKPLTKQHCMGGVLVFLSLFWFEFGRSKGKNQIKQTPIAK